MYNYSEHPRRNFMIFCFLVHLYGALASIICDKLEDNMSDDVPELVLYVGLPLIALPIVYIVFYNRFTGEHDNAVIKHLKEMGTWLIFVFPIGYIMYSILDSGAFYEFTDLYPSEKYLVVIAASSLSIIFETPIFKLVRMIVSGGKNKSPCDAYGYYCKNTAVSPQAPEYYR